MYVPVILFVDIIRNSGGRIATEYDNYYFYCDKFWIITDYTQHNNIGFSTSNLLEMIGKHVDYEKVKSKYNELKKEYCLEEGRIERYLREYKLNCLLD